MKILVLEDNINLLELIQEELEEKGFEVVCFKDGLEALENCIGGV